MQQTKTKRALIVSPYLDHLGGGERYMLTIGKTLQDLGYEIFFSWDNQADINILAGMLGISFEAFSLDSQVKELYHQKNPLAMYFATQKYDLTVYLSDGSIPLLGSRQNLVHMQVPFHGVGGQSLKNKLKKTTLSHIIVNSKFTKQIVDQEYGINSTVLYPPVPLIERATTTKENIILSVGRFEPSLNAKKQDILIKAFKLFSQDNPEWKLCLAGGSSSESWLDELRKLASGYPIEFYDNVAYDKLQNLYQQATIYWHAAGYEVDEQKNPELTEHFGITTVEALSAGCIAFVVGKGGQTEIITDANYYWKNPTELATKTKIWLKNPTPQDFDLTPYASATFAQNIKKLITIK